MAFKKKTSIVILGGGITGLTVAARLERAGLDYLLVEAQELGGAIKSQEVNGAILDYGLKSIPLTGPLNENPLVQLKEELDLKIQIESFTEGAKFFDNKSFSEFVGFGEIKNRQLIDELGYYTLSPRLLVSGGWRALTEELTALIPEEKRITDAHITKIEVQDEKAVSLAINGESTITAENFVFTFSPSMLKDLLAIGTVGGKTLQRIARTEPLTAISLDIATEKSFSDLKNIFILRDYSKTTEEEFFVLGQFSGNLDPLKRSGGFHISTWMTFINSETFMNDEDSSKSIKNMKKVITKAFPQLVESAKWERLLVIPEAVGNFSQLTLEKNSTLPGIGNLFICGGKVQHQSLRNLGLALESSKKVSQELTNSVFTDLGVRLVRQRFDDSAFSSS